MYIGEDDFTPKVSAQLLMSAIAETPRSHITSIQYLILASFSSLEVVSRRAFIWSMKPAMPVPFLNSLCMEESSRWQWVFTKPGTIAPSMNISSDSGSSQVPVSTTVPSWSVTT